MTVEIRGTLKQLQTSQISISDAPADEEVVVVAGASIAGHPDHCISNRYQECEEVGHELDNPAGI